jgi:trans-2,3-dihydro-3-hydroxyanthranilate isomerase
MRRRFVTLDVFTDRRFAGNPLAVVLDADGLDREAMQAVAREFNLSETVFVLSPANAAHRARLRIFTPAAELPFAGHPTVGTAVLLAGEDGAGKDGGAGKCEFVLEEDIGAIGCLAEPHGRDGGYAAFTLPRLPEHVGDAAGAAEIAAALGLSLDDLGCDSFELGRWSAGLSLVMVPVRGLDAIGRARPDGKHWDAAFNAAGQQAAFLYCRQTVQAQHAFHARLFAPALGIPEDPATGSAVAAFAGLVVRHGGLADGEHTLAIEQGYEMGRPSVIRLSLSLRGGALVTASIGGDAVRVTEGTIEA